MVTTLLAFWIYIYHCNVIINAQCGYVEYGNLVHPLDTCSLSYEHTNSDIFEENWKSITFTCEETGTDDNVYANYYSEPSCTGPLMSKQILPDANYDCNGSPDIHCMWWSYRITPCWNPDGDTEVSINNTINYTLVANICPVNGVKVICDRQGATEFIECQNQEQQGEPLSPSHFPDHCDCCNSHSMCDSVEEKKEKSSSLMVIIIIVAVIVILMVFVILALIFFLRKRKRLKAQLTGQYEVKKQSEPINDTAGAGTEQQMEDVNIVPSAPMEVPQMGEEGGARNKYVDKETRSYS